MSRAALSAESDEKNMKRVEKSRKKNLRAIAATLVGVFALTLAARAAETPALSVSAEEMFNASMTMISQGMRGEAAAMLVRIADEYPSNQLAAEALVQLGRLYENMGRTAEAEAAYLRAATEHSAHPRAAESLALSADITRRSGRNADAAAMYETALDIYPDSGVADRVRFDLAFLYEGMGRRVESEGLLRSLAARGDAVIAERAQRELIQVYIRAGMLYEAETAAIAFLSSRPEDVSVRMQLFNVLMERGKFDDATPVIEGLTHEQPGNRGFRELMFKAYRNAGKLKNLIADLERRKKNNPADLEPVRWLKDLYVWDEKTIEAMLELEIIVGAEPGNVADAVELSKMYFKEEWVTKARETLERALEHKPGYEPALRELGALWLAEGEPEKALDAWRAAASFNPDDVQSYQRLSSYFRLYRMYDRVTELFAQGRERLGQPSLFARDMAWIFQMQMRHREALAEYLKVASEAPGDIGAREAIFKILEVEGVAAEGVGIIERAADARPENTELWLMAAEALALNGDEAGAKRRLEAVTTSRADARSEVARRLMAKAAPARAARLFEDAAEFELGDPSIKLMQAGRAWLAAGDYARAEINFRRVADEFHNASHADEALARIARISAERGDTLAARGYYARLSAEHPMSAHRTLADVEEAIAAFKLGEYDHARDAFERLSADPRAQRFADRVLFHRAELERFSLRFDAASELYMSLARRYPESRHVGDAISRALFLEDAESADPIHVQALTAAERKMLAGDSEGAEAMLRGLGVALPEGAMRDHAGFMLATLLENTGDFESAAVAYAELADATGVSELKAPACVRLAGLFVSMGRHADALAYYQRAIDEAPRSYWAQLARQGAGALKDLF